MPKSVTQLLGIDKKAFRNTRALDTILDVDTHLFIDPLLLRKTSAPELAAGIGKIEKRFTDILDLLKHSKGIGDLWSKKASALMHFPEVKGICIGYSSHGTAGSGMGPALRERLLETARQIIAVGVREPDIFELAGLFEEDIGPDRISDMVAGILKSELIAYSERIFVELGVIGKRKSSEDIPDLPKNPFNEEPIILVPKDILRDLPLALDWSDVSLVAAHNEALRNEVNNLIGSTWRTAATRALKKDVKDVILKHPEVLQDLIEQYRKRVAATYDFEDDPAGQVIWYETALATAAQYPLQFDLPKRPTIEEVRKVVLAICERFRDLVENHGLWKLLYDKAGRPKHEEAAQLLFYGIADAYCEADNVALSRESNGGRGPVDFKFSGGYQLSVVVEVKLSRNNALIKGFTKQLPAYSIAEKAKRGVYLVIDNGASARKMRSFNDVVVGSRESSLQVFTVDGTPKKSASKLSN